MQPLFEHRLELAGYETRALELEGDGPPLLLLHGWADSADTWRIVLDRLGRSDRRTLALDLPGFGTADPLEGGPVLPQLDRFAAAALDYLAPRGGAVAAGNSLGGTVAMRLAERAAADTRGVVPIAPAGLDMARWFVIVERDPILRALLAAPLPVPGFVYRAAVGEIYRRLAFAVPRRADPRVVGAFAGHLSSRAQIARRLELGRRLLPELRDAFELDRIACPVLLVWGRQDLLVFQTGAKRVLDAVDEGRLITIDGCGHCPQIEAPERLTELLLDFPSPLVRAA